jgi:hypothetical protein
VQGRFYRSRIALDTAREANQFRKLATAGLLQPGISLLILLRTEHLGECLRAPLQPSNRWTRPFQLLQERLNGRFQRLERAEQPPDNLAGRKRRSSPWCSSLYRRATDPWSSHHRRWWRKDPLPTCPPRDQGQRAREPLRLDLTPHLPSVGLCGWKAFRQIRRRAAEFAWQRWPGRPFREGEGQQLAAHGLAVHAQLRCNRAHAFSGLA